MDSCPTPEEFQNAIQKVKLLTGFDLEKELSECPPEFGGKRKKRKMKGGAVTTKQVKVVIYLLLTIIIAKATFGAGNTSVIKEGINSIIDGSCLKSISGAKILNPLCNQYFGIVLKIKQVLLKGTGMTEIVAIIYAINKGSHMIDFMVTQLAEALATTINNIAIPLGSGMINNVAIPLGNGIGSILSTTPARLRPLLERSSPSNELPPGLRRRNVLGRGEQPVRESGNSIGAFVDYEEYDPDPDSIASIRRRQWEESKKNRGGRRTRRKTKKGGKKRRKRTRCAKK